MRTVYETDRATARFICKHCGEDSSSLLVLQYATTVEFRGHWLMTTEVEASSGEAYCHHCDRLNVDIWPKSHVEVKWERRQ